MQLKEFTTGAARPLPVILLADVSGSMHADGKIAALNASIRDMLASFATTDDQGAEIHVAIITFGGTAEVQTPLATANTVQWTDLTARGSTPMGKAMELAADLIEDREKIPARAYRPTVVLLSDGQPDPGWENGLTRMTKEGRAQKADRMALAIGADADVDVLRRFVAPATDRLFGAADARRIRDFFNFLTMSVATRTRSVNPNELPPMQDPYDLDRL
ncbi:vWA domain-containing protein [Thiocapsa roseopersicina]|uniref:Uncharacterized conserved protein YegL, contains vWA domain of TerY type n=1 Tax=Thiocapsa roseopersicina TaxID=1058 RepID=A0A1H2Y9R1_THIRO|nr:VWA domain-containing protein [Thiocapsa roseopersicina]SDX01780.1 Uncharacterized conserved protein YegL, contains vWA domain of TerY type [Thiocapsa roseopersicina]